MSRPIVINHDLATNEITERVMNDTEYAEFEASIAANQAAKADQAQKEIAKQAVLDKLGLTADEVAVLLS